MQKRLTCISCQRGEHFEPCHWGKTRVCSWVSSLGAPIPRRVYDAHWGHSTPLLWDWRVPIVLASFQHWVQPKKKRKGHLKKYLKSTGRTLRHYLQQSYRNQTYHKNLAEFQHFRHFLQESFKRLTFQTKYVCFLQIRDFLQVQAFLKILRRIL